MESRCKKVSRVNAALRLLDFARTAGAQYQRLSDFCKLQLCASIALKSHPCEWLLQFDLFGGVSGDIAQTKSHANLALCDLRDFEKEKGKMSILAAQRRPCKCSLIRFSTYVLYQLSRNGIKFCSKCFSSICFGLAWLFSHLIDISAFQCSDICGLIKGSFHFGVNQEFFSSPLTLL